LSGSVDFVAVVVCTVAASWSNSVARSSASCDPCSLLHQSHRRSAIIQSQQTSPRCYYDTPGTSFDNHCTLI